MSDPIGDVSGGNFSISGVMDGIGSKLSAEKDSLGTMMDGYNPDDPMSALNIEMEVSKYKAEMSLMAALVKDLSEIQQQIIQKI